MEIPTEFKLFGQTVEVTKDCTLTEKEDATGMARYRENKIVLQCHKSLGRPDSQLEQVYMHEVIHFALHHLSYHKANDDELFVDQLANALHQIAVTSVYEDKKKTKKTRK
jgi:predicted SprT family Zn-dependent metalloprotease